MTSPSEHLQHLLVSRLKLRHLALLQQIERHRTLSRVAAEMRLTQPAITKALQEIEDVFMTRLFDRTRRGLEPTRAGQAALRYAQVLLAESASAAQALAAIDGGLGGRLRIGWTPQVPDVLRNAVFTHLLGQQPRVAVVAREGTTDELVAAINSRSLDCAIARSYQEGGGADFVQEAIYEQEPALIVPARSRARLARAPLDWAQLAQLDWILPPPNTPMRRTFSAMFLSAGVQPPSPIAETTSLRGIETVLSLEPASITILARDVGLEMATRGGCAVLPQRLTWNLPPVSLFVARAAAGHPIVQSLTHVIRQAAQATRG